VSDSIRVITPDVAVLEILFTDNMLLNGPGIDLVIFEKSGALGAGTPDPTERFEVTVFNGSEFPPLVSFDPVDTGIPWTEGGLNLFVVEIDVSDFGVPAGATTQRVRIGLVDNLVHRSADPTALGALNSVPIPEPSTALLLAFGLVGPAMGRRRWGGRGNTVSHWHASAEWAWWR
jgi:hypothetical protein